MRAGIDVIVTDHHLPGGALPDCLAVLNPKRRGCGYPDKDLAAVGVAFKLALALAGAMEASENFVWAMLDLVALATIADIAPLRGENRVFARYGLKMLAETRNIGLRALIRAAGLEGKPLTAGRVGFILAPRLNAVGRLGHALRGVELLMTEDEHEANAIARELEELNRQRQEIDRATLEQARERVLQLDLDETYGIVLADEGWHPGVIGIVASRIVEEFGRPTILIALEGDEGKGSGRSISGFDLHGGLGAVQIYLLRFGGHRAAAGVTIARDQRRRVRGALQRSRPIALTPDDLVPELRVDLEMRIDGMDQTIESLLRHFEPCGIGNPAPVLLARNVRLARRRGLVGQDGLKLRLDTGAGALEALGWGLAPRVAERAQPGSRIDIAFRLERDEYRGASRLQARIADLRIAPKRNAHRRRPVARTEISAPAGSRVRPTADRVREAWMSILQLDIPGARVLDLFAGSGALGLEALSRGATSADFVENAPPSLRALQENIEALGAAIARRPPQGDALRFRGRLGAPLRRRVRRSALRGRRRGRGSPSAGWGPFAGVLGVEHRPRRLECRDGGDTRVRRDRDHLLPQRGMTW